MTDILMPQVKTLSAEVERAEKLAQQKADAAKALQVRVRVRVRMCVDSVCTCVMMATLIRHNSTPRTRSCRH
jgi:hypothetical protein